MKLPTVPSTCFTSRTTYGTTVKPETTPYLEQAADADVFVYYYRYGLEQAVRLWLCQDGVCTYRTWRYVWGRRSGDKWIPKKNISVTEDDFRDCGKRSIQLGILEIQSSESPNLGTTNNSHYVCCKLIDKADGVCKRHEYHVQARIHRTDARHLRIRNTVESFPHE